MRKNFSKYVVICFTCCVVFINLRNSEWCYSKEANLKLQDGSYHQSFAPYNIEDILPEGTISKPNKVVTVKVKEITTYEVPVDEDKIKTNKLNINDLEISEVHDPEKINFHQVDCYFYSEVSQVQTKSAEGVKCTRIRKGNQYWLSDGRKCVEWQPWSEWDCGSLNW